MIDSFAFHLPAARVFLPQGFSLACIDADLCQRSLGAHFSTAFEVCYGFGGQGLGFGFAGCRKGELCGFPDRFWI